MKGLVLTEIGKVSLQEVEKPKIIDDTDVVIRVTLCTICGSDIHLMHGGIASEPPYVLGHEYAGVIEEVGSAVKGFKPGDRVCGPPAVWCGRCDNCLKGAIAQCENGGIHGSGPTAGGLSGAQSEYMRIPYADGILLHVPDDMSDEVALLICDNVSTGFFAVENGEAFPGDVALIFGAGPVGLCAIACTKLFGVSTVISVEYDDFRLQKAKEMGADHIINANEDVVAKVMEITGGKGVDFAAECAGDYKAFREGVLCCGVGGRVSVVGIGEKMDIPLPDAFVKNINIKSGLGYLGNLKRLMNLVHKRKINVAPVITHRIKLADIEAAYPMFEKREDNVIKIAVTP
ncbi:MAG: alcohol dehydrogenase catalytic domain-containing protein [Clostridiales Family XIII bacterium]|jgi:alcohol dehydrogenase|nr:alcohol dehydrogenase catalytic domain-containing protein [Clostridiales Family XIII bacterium]